MIEISSLEFVDVVKTQRNHFISNTGKMTEYSELCGQSRIDPSISFLINVATPELKFNYLGIVE